MSTLRSSLLSEDEEAPRTPSPQVTNFDEEIRSSPLSISETYQLIQTYYPKSTESRFFLENAPDIVPLTWSPVIPIPIPSIQINSTPTSLTKSKPKFPTLSWTPYNNVVKDSSRTYLLGMIILHGKPTGYALSINVWDKAEDRKVLFKFIGKHVGGLRWVMAFDVLGVDDLEFEVGEKQGKKEIVVFGETLKELVKKFEGVGGVEGLEGSGEGEEVEEKDGEWSFLLSPLKPPSTTATPTSQQFPDSPPSASITSDANLLSQIHRTLNPPTPIPVPTTKTKKLKPKVQFSGSPIQNRIATPHPLKRSHSSTHILPLPKLTPSQKKMIEDTGAVISDFASSVRKEFRVEVDEGDGGWDVEVKGKGRKKGGVELVVRIPIITPMHVKMGCGLLVAMFLLWVGYRLGIWVESRALRDED